MKVRTLPCPVCGTTTILDVDGDSWEKWQQGMLIQNAFPRMSKITRELLMTGTHDHCWDEMFTEEEK